MTWFEATILAIVEGITKFLPISSTGHLILTSYFFGISEDPYVKSFNIIIQVGAIMAVLFLYWRRFLPKKDFYTRLIFAFAPAAVLGLLVKKKIDLVLGSHVVVAWALVIGGFVLMWLDRLSRNEKVKTTIDTLSVKQCILIGFVQCCAFIPGVSRAASAILGGTLVGLSKREAAEFSFFLAVPTLAGASLIKGLQIVDTINLSEIQFLIYGTILSFLVAVFAIKTFINLLVRIGYTGFGVYRIALGILVLTLF